MSAGADDMCSPMFAKMNAFAYVQLLFLFFVVVVFSSFTVIHLSNDQSI